MKIIVDGTIYGIQRYGGINRVFNEILPRICYFDKNIRIRLIYPFSRNRLILPKYKNIALCGVPVLGRKSSQSIAHTFNKISYSLLSKIYFAGFKDAIWHSTWYSLPAKYIKGPYIVTVYDMINEKYPELVVKNNNEILYKKKQSILSAAAIICISQVTANDLVFHYKISEKKISVIPLAANKMLFQKRTGSRIRKDYLLYIGARTGYKSFEWFINAFSSFKNKGNLTIKVVGLPLTYQEKKLIISLNLENRISIITDANDESLAKLYAEASAFIYPSIYEGFGIPLLEAMASSCPAVVSDIEIFREIGGNNPFYFSPRNTESFHNALSSALSRNIDTSSGYERAKQFTWELAAKKTLQLYKNIQSS
jgi:glycosyltransferase involved in cell wall biosynthesis